MLLGGSPPKPDEAILTAPYFEFRVDIPDFGTTSLYNLGRQELKKRLQFGSEFLKQAGRYAAVVGAPNHQHVMRRKQVHWMD